MSSAPLTDRHAGQRKEAQFRIRLASYEYITLRSPFTTRPTL
jgi:hypothetical protein